MTHAQASTPLRFATVSDGQGGQRHVLRLVPPAPAKRGGKRQAPDPMKASAESAAQQLCQFIERYERLAEEKQGIADDQRDVLTEAKGSGFDVPTMLAIVKRRKKDAMSLQEADALLETYRTALGLA